MQRWPWASVFSKACYWALAYVALNIVVGKVVTLGLSALSTFLARQGWPLWVTAAAFFAIGVALLLVPFMPGVPIYLAAGVVLTSAAQAETSGSGGSAVDLRLVVLSKCEQRRHQGTTLLPSLAAER